MITIAVYISRINHHLQRANFSIDIDRVTLKCDLLTFKYDLEKL